MRQSNGERVEGYYGTAKGIARPARRGVKSSLMSVGPLLRSLRNPDIQSKLRGKQYDEGKDMTRNNTEQRKPQAFQG